MMLIWTPLQDWLTAIRPGPAMAGVVLGLIMITLLIRATSKGGGS